MENPPIADRPRRDRARAVLVALALIVALGPTLTASSPRPTDQALAAPASVAPSPGASASPGVSPLKVHAGRRPAHHRSRMPQAAATPSPAHRPSAKRHRRPVSTCGAPRNPYRLNLCGHGHQVTSPPKDVCTYFACVDFFWSGRGYMVRCNDGRFGLTGGRLGSCVWHRGEGRPVHTG